MIHYFLQVIVFQALFLGIYELFLKKETFFSLNRTYLLITPFLAAIVPLLEFEFLNDFVPLEGIVQLPELILSGGDSSQQVSTALDLAFLESSVYFLKTKGLLVIYLIGTLVSSTFFLRKYLQLQRLESSGKCEKHGAVTIIRIPKSRMACTFFNTVFLGKDLSEEETNQILPHELAHVEQKHSWDLLLFEMFRIILWFDPFIYRHQSQLSTLHEYIADEKVTRNAEKTTYLQNLLNSTFGTQQLSFTNQFFNHSLIKKRIMMLQKPKSNRNAKLKFFLIIPLMLAMLTYVACSEESKTNTHESQEIAPPPPPAMKSTNGSSAKVAEVPFAIIESVPVFPGCENLEDNEARKKCMSTKIREFVNAHFDRNLVEKSAVKGKNRITVIFKIDHTGKVVNVRAKSENPILKKEAIRVVESIPNMIPGKQKGVAVDVLYTLPIIFQVN